VAKGFLFSVDMFLAHINAKQTNYYWA
jgi:hypothetical protein